MTFNFTNQLTKAIHNSDDIKNSGTFDDIAQFQLIKRFKLYSN